MAEWFGLYLFALVIAVPVWKLAKAIEKHRDRNVTITFAKPIRFVRSTPDETLDGEPSDG